MASRGQSLRSNELASLLGSSGGGGGGDGANISGEQQHSNIFAPSFAAASNKKARDLRPEQSSAKVASAPKTRYRRGRGSRGGDADGSSSSSSEEEDVFDGLIKGATSRSSKQQGKDEEDDVHANVPHPTSIRRHRHRRRASSSSSSSEASNNSSSSSSSSEDEDIVEERRRRIRERAKLQQKKQQSRRSSDGSSSSSSSTEQQHKHNEHQHQQLESKHTSSSSDSSSSSSSDSSEDESSSDEDSAQQPRIRMSKPVFIPKNKRGTAMVAQLEAEKQAALALKRQDKKDKRAKESRLMVAQLVQKANDKNQVKKDDDGWIAMPDDDDDGPNCDEKLEYENWEVRELMRLLRDIDEAEDEENELAELERRRNMTEADRRREDEALGKFSRKDKPKGKFMQRYYHKGAFYMDEDSLKDKDDVRHKAEEYARAATGEDKYDKKNLPKVMQVKKFGMSGYSTKYRGLVKEDTTDKEIQYIPAKRRKGEPRV
eukprot:CAMPEP_0116031602 /NCGR_PEP_ID=MMETSP0321-20121206/17654_1 /TAXON_ID=163516 /ORGANISM="Leptocylindrus danicus var. danicus, Strain B650" /LENGTH=486 /DNA_ID=CAMNT_0003506843 /DNA_START=287 /DNA_END=1748 /DNA_ORIENTATION=-